jgi:hypothetical protein
MTAAETKVSLSADAIRGVIAEIERIATAGDVERAHGLKDELLAQVIRDIADYESGEITESTAYRMRGLARAALKALDVDFGWAGP